MTHKTLLDVWELSQEDIKQYVYCCGGQNNSNDDGRSEPNDPIIGGIDPSIPDEELGVLKEASVSKHGYDFTHYRRNPLPSVEALIPQVSHLYRDDVSFVGGCVSDSASEKTVCNWCNWTNELQLSWCENCGRVINSSQDSFKMKDDPCRSCDHQLQALNSINYPATKTSSTSRTHRCSEMHYKSSSYHRHWRTSSLAKSPAKHLLPKNGTVYV